MACVLVPRMFEVAPVALVISSLVFARVSSRCWLARPSQGEGLLHWVRRSGFISSTSKGVADLAANGFCVLTCSVSVRVISASTRTPATQLASLSSDFELGHGFLVGLNCFAATGLKLALRHAVTPCLKAFKCGAAVAFFPRHPLFVSRDRGTSARQVTSRPNVKEQIMLEPRRALQSFSLRLSRCQLPWRTRKSRISGLVVVSGKVPLSVVFVPCVCLSVILAWCSEGLCKTISLAASSRK